MLLGWFLAVVHESCVLPGQQHGSLTILKPLGMLQHALNCFLDLLFWFKDVPLPLRSSAGFTVPTNRQQGVIFSSLVHPAPVQFSTAGACWLALDCMQD